jgi:hypothetical protein
MRMAMGLAAVAISVVAALFAVNAWVVSRVTCGGICNLHAESPDARYTSARLGTRPERPMNLIRSAFALLIVAFATGLSVAQVPLTGEITVHTVEILDSTMYHPNYTSNATVVKSSNPTVPKGTVARLILIRDPDTKIYSVHVTGLIINSALVPAVSGPATLSTGFLNKAGNAAKMRGDGHTPSLGGGQVFLPAETNINFVLGPPVTQQ